MRKFLTTILLALLYAGSAVADEVMVDNITVPQNIPATLTISLNNNNSYRQLFQLKLVLPEGVTMVENSQKLSGRFGANAILQYNEVSNRVYQFICQSGIDINPITGDNGSIMTVELKADENLAVGTELQGSVTEIEVTTAEVEAWNPDDVDFTITIGEPADQRTVLDENATTVPVAAEGVDVLVKRTLTAGKWSSICLPFAMTEAQTKAAFGGDVQIADFTGCEPTYDETEENIVNLKVNFSYVTTMAANHPYIIKVGGNKTQFSVDGVDIAPSEVLSVDCDENKYMSNGKWYYDYNSFIGTYVADTEVPENDLFLSDNKFWYSTGATKSKAFRGYFSFYMILSELTNAETRINLWIGDVEITGVGSNDNGTLETDPWYDLNGRKVHKPSKKTVYIKNGQKVVVK